MTLISIGVLNNCILPYKRAFTQIIPSRWLFFQAFLKIIHNVHIYFLEESKPYYNNILTTIENLIIDSIDGNAFKLKIGDLCKIAFFYQMMLTYFTLKWLTSILQKKDWGIGKQVPQTYLYSSYFLSAVS